MAFQVGNNENEKRMVRTGGRPAKTKIAAMQLVKDILEANATKLANQYIKRALDKYGDRVLCHAIDKLLPDDRNATIQPTAIIHQFIQFGASAPNNQNTLQLPAEGVSAPLLVGDGRGQEEGSAGVASEKRQGQDGLEFHSFTHVRGK